MDKRIPIWRPLIIFVIIACIIAYCVACSKQIHAPKGVVTKYPALFDQITHIMQTNGLEIMIDWPWDSNQHPNSFMALTNNADTRYFSAGNYSENDFVFLKVNIKHESGTAGVNSWYSGTPDRREQAAHLKQIIEAIVEESKSK